MMMGTMATDKYPPNAELLESVGVKAMKVSEPTTTLSALLGSLSGAVSARVYPTLWESMPPRLLQYRCHHRSQTPKPGVWAASVVASPGSLFCGVWKFCPPAFQMRPVYLARMISALILIRMLIGVRYVFSRNGWLGIVGNL